MDNEKVAGELVRIARSLVARDVVELLTYVPIDYDLSNQTDEYQDTDQDVIRELKRIRGVTKVKVVKNRHWEVYSDVPVSDASDDVIVEDAAMTMEDDIRETLDIMGRHDWYGEFIFRNWDEKKFRTDILS